NTFRSLTSWRRDSSCAQAVASTRRKRSIEGSDNGSDQASISVAAGEGAPARRFYADLATLPALRQRVQTYTRRGLPPSSIRTFWRFGLKRRLVATIEWLRLWPKAGFLPQEWQTLDMGARF